uniref:Uncharacterized protein LOC8276725 isoform X1 n=1 Tax=Rhizophora mucronata TaxID=61149 RepID=A0A2P2J8Z1_RHIMU
MVKTHLKLLHGRVGSIPQFFPHRCKVHWMINHIEIIRKLIKINWFSIYTISVLLLKLVKNQLQRPLLWQWQSIGITRRRPWN